jgi:hypothetical protein
VNLDCEPLRLVVRQVQRHQASSKASSDSSQQNNMLWIQISITNRLLIAIVECILTNAADHFYAEHALVANQFDSQVFYSLLAGLDAITFTPSPKLFVLAAPNTVSSPTQQQQYQQQHPSQRLVSSPYNKKQQHGDPRLESFISPIFNRHRGNHYTNNKSNNTFSNSFSNYSSSSNHNNSLTNSAKKRENIKKLCVNIETRIVSRVFYEWLNMHRKNRLIKSSLTHLVKVSPPQLTESETCDVDRSLAQYLKVGKKLDHTLWSQLVDARGQFNVDRFYQLVYANGIQTHELRRKVWPYLLHLYEFNMTGEQVEAKRKQAADNYNRVVGEWRPFEQYKRVVDEYSVNTTINVSI